MSKSHVSWNLQYNNNDCRGRDGADISKAQHLFVGLSLFCFQNRLVQYVKVTSETNVNAFGEIMFLEQGKNPTYSPVNIRHDLIKFCCSTFK